MPAGTEMARLKRNIEALAEAIRLDLKPGSKTPMTPAERRTLRSELQSCMQSLDELGSRLSG
jgi:hypothetical protein